MTEIVELPKSLKKQPRESDAAHAALIAYYELGPGRGLRDLHELFKDQAEEGLAVPSESYSTLGAWCSRFDWNQRIEAVQQDQYAAEIQALHQARVKFVRKQIDMLEMWEKMLIMGTPNLDDVSFDKWSKSAKDFVSAIGQVFGLEDRDINVNVRDERERPVDVDAATTELMGILKSARERAELEVAARDQEIIDLESRPVRHGSEGE